MNTRFALTAFAAGLLFATGLALSGMTDPANVQGFLDFAGDWRPALAFVMGGAVLTYGIAYRIITRRERPLLATRFSLPTRRVITGDLVVGSLLFGAGWGLAGYCPGPALTSSVTGAPNVLAFIASMFAGMQLYRVFDALRARRAEESTPQTEPKAALQNA